MDAVSCRGRRSPVRPAPLKALARQLPETLRRNGSEARRLTGSSEAATVWEEAARITETSIREALLTPLTLQQAVEESGYTASHLQRLVREGRLPNSGTERDLRILRKHLPQKPGHGVDAASSVAASSSMQAARADRRGDA